jgi:hypothetical protein
LTVKSNDSVVLGMAGDIGSAVGSVGATARLRAQLPLVSANSGVHAVAGTAQGPLRVQLSVQLPPLAIPLNGVIIEASIAPPDVGVIVTLRGLALGGGPPQDVVLDPTQLSSEAAQLLVALLKQVLSQLTATVTAGSEPEAVVHHLTGLLGLDGDGVPMFPSADLASNAASLQNWLRALTQAPAMGKWLGHLAGLIGAGEVAITGDGSQANPWAVQVLPFDAQSGLCLFVWTTPEAARFGVRASLMPGGAAPPGRVDAEAIVASIPLDGTGSAVVLPSMSIAFRAPGAPAGPSLVSSAQITVGSLRGGVLWDGGTLRPLLELDQVTLAGPPSANYNRIDLVDTDSVAAAASSAVRDTILAALGAGPGAHLAALAGLAAPSGDPGSPHHGELNGLPADWPTLADPGGPGSLLSDPFTGLRNWLAAVATGLSADGTPFLSLGLNWLQAFLNGSVPDSPDTALPPAAFTGSGTYADPWALALTSDTPPADALVWLEPSGPPSAWAGTLSALATNARDYDSLLNIVSQLGGFVSSAEDAASGLGPGLSAALGLLNAYLTTSDGVVPVSAQIPTGGSWTAGTPITAAHSRQPHDDSAITQILTQIDTWAGGAAGSRVVLLLGPSFSDHTIWSDLLASSNRHGTTDPSANFILRVPGVDPSAVNLTAVTAAVDYYTADLADDGMGNTTSLTDQIGRIVARIGQLRPGTPVTIVAHSTAGVAARAYTSASPAQVRGLITLGTPHFGADLPYLNNADVASAVRFLQGLRPGMASSPLRDALDHIVEAIDGYLPPQSPGMLPVLAPYPVGSFAGTASTDTGGRPALALGGTLTTDLLDFAKQAASTLAGQAAGAARPAPTHMRFGLRIHALLPAPNPGDVQVDVSVRMNLFRVALTSDVSTPPGSAQAFGVRISLSRPGDWLVGAPQSYAGLGNPLSDVRVRRCEFGIDVGAGTASGQLAPNPFLTLYQAAYHGQTLARVQITESGAQALLGEVMHAISVPPPGSNSQVARLLGALQSLGIVTPETQAPALGISADAFNAIVTDAASFFDSRLAGALHTPQGLLGFSGTGSGPWTFPLGTLPIQVVIWLPWTLSIQTTGSGLTLAPNSTLSFSAGVTIPDLTPQLNATLRLAALNVTYNQSTKTLVAQALPWLAPFQLLPAPSAATLAATLNNVLPRLLFSAAGGTLLESLLGRGFIVPPLDSFFADSSGAAQRSPGIGNSTGDGFDSVRINNLLQAINHLAGFAASPGLTIPPGFQLTASGTGTDADPVTLHLTTTAPLGGVLDVQLTAAIDKLRHVTPGGTLSLTTPLHGSWPAVTVTFGFTGLQVSLAVAPQGVSAIQILPTFSGLGSLRGAATALLPQALDALVDALSNPGPAPQWLLDGLAVAQALGLYDNVGHFSAHAPDLHALVDGNYLNLFNPAQRQSVATAIATFLNGLGAFPTAVSASGPAVSWQFSLAAPNTGTVGLSLGWDGSGPLAQISITGTKLASGPITTDLTAGYSGGTLRCSVELGVSLVATLGIPLAPKFSAGVAGNHFQVNFYPLATVGANGPLTVTLAPSVGVQSDAGTATALVDTLLIPLVADVVIAAVQPKLTTNLWTGGPTLETALLAAQIIQKGATPPQDTLQMPLPPITTVTAGLAAALLPNAINIAPKLKLSTAHQNSRTGIALQGSVDFPVGSYVLSVLSGAPDRWAADSPGANAGLTLFLFNDLLQFNPGLLVAGLGLGITGADDAPLVDLSGFRLGGFNGYLFFDVELQGGLTVNSFGGGLELASLGLPLGLAIGPSAGGNNPVAASLLRSDGGAGGNPGDSHPVNPGVDVDAWYWSGPRGDGQFHIQFGGQTGTLWIGIHSGFGPIYIDQLGLDIRNAEVDLLIDGTVKVNGLTAQTYELTVEVPYKSITTPSGWSLDLKGLAIGFNSPGVTISGALVKSDGPPIEYDGMLLIEISDLGFIAIGAYSTPTDPSLGDTYTSLFVFAGVFVTIGIPPIIDISGLGLGVGYNREIIIPNDLTQIPNFLLVEALDHPDQIADDPMGALLQLRDQLPARRGSFWLAVGLRGTTFAIVNVTGVLYIALDRGVDIGLIGVARMALPADDSALVSVELALKVRFSSTEEVFSIQAQLTDNSYLLSRDCQLTGGFAYFVWFSQSQFLLTLGGYHPAFHKRPEFPDVPRLGYHWSFLGVVAIKGESYFALTNTCVMAGTRLDATYGPGWLFVWFSADCDFLISWDPFYYDIAIGVSVGATFRLHICFIGCVDIDITVSIGASLHVLRPPFHGEVTVDLAVASVTVPFGPNPNPQPQPISWSAFVSNYLHSGTTGNEPVLAHVISGLQPPEPAGGQPSPGTQDQPWKMTPEFSFRTETRMPAMEFSFLAPLLTRSENQIPTLVFGHYGPLSTVFPFDLAPLLIDNAHHGLTSEHRVLLEGWDSESKSWLPIVPADNPTPPKNQNFAVDATHFQLEPIIGQVSEGPYHLLPPDSVPAAANTLPVLTGLKITGVAVLRHPSQPIPITSLYDYGFSRPLPFATWSLAQLANLQALGATADTLSQVAAGATTQTTLSTAHAMLSGGGFFADARTASGLPRAGLPPVAARSLLHFRSSPPAIVPITSGLTMQPVGQAAPPVINRVPIVLPVILQAPRLRAVLQARPLPTIDSPPLLRTTVATIAAAQTAPRFTPPKLDTLPGAKLHFVRAANAPRPTALARSARTLRSAEVGWPLGPAHVAQFQQAAALIGGDGVPLGTFQQSRGKWLRFPESPPRA